MDDVDRVRQWFAEGRVVHPLARPTTVHLARAVASVAGASTALDDESREIAANIGESEHLIFVLADGFGMNLMEQLPATSLLRTHCIRRISAVFPSSTAPALTSFATGEWPASHGLLFWWQYMEESDISVFTLPFRERFTRRPLDELGITSEQLFHSPPRITTIPRGVLSFQPSRSADSVYSGYCYAGTPVYGYESTEDAFATVEHRVRTAKEPTYTYVYHSAIDHVEHDHGADSPEALAVLTQFDREIRELAEAVSGRARIVISADHGQFHVDDSNVLFVEEDDELLRYLKCVPTGEGPEPAFHVRPGRGSDFESVFRRRFRDHYALLRRSEVEELQILGPEPLSNLARARLGDYLALTADPVVLRYRPEAGSMPGDHGGLSRDEMEIPLIVI
jgi:hypothetical protein